MVSLCIRLFWYVLVSCHVFHLPQRRQICLEFVCLFGRSFLMYIQEASCWFRNVFFDVFHVPQPRQICLEKFLGLFCRSFLYVSFDIYRSILWVTLDVFHIPQRLNQKFTLAKGRSYISPVLHRSLLVHIGLFWRDWSLLAGLVSFDVIYIPQLLWQHLASVAVFSVVAQKIRNCEV